MKVLELYAGSRSIGKEAEALGYEVFSVDIKSFENIDLVIDIELLTIKHLPWIPDIIWIGTPCTTYSIAGIQNHRKEDYSPVSEFAIKCDRMNQNNLHLIKELLVLNPDLVWYIENPVGVLRKMHFMRGLPRATVWYCQYGDNRAKPTDIWSNNIYSLFNPNGWNPRPKCRNFKYDDEGNVINRHCHHDASQRGTTQRGLRSRGYDIPLLGTTGQKDNYERSKMPRELCIEILKAIR